MKNSPREKRIRRERRIRSRVRGTAACPRLSVFRSNRHIAAQFIDDTTRQTIVAASDLEFSKGKKAKGTRTDVARKVGELAAKKALEKKVEKAVFDRGGYRYHGIVKAFAEGARKGGLKL